MKILYGTTNPAKLKHMRLLLQGLDIELVGLNDINIELPKVLECGATPLKNARLKARTYFDATGMPVFSCDSGLYIEGLSVDAQPGVHARRKHQINDERIDASMVQEMTDEEMILYYSDIARNLGGEAFAWYENAICFMLPNGEFYEKQGGDLSSERFLIVTQPHANKEEGFPIDCLSVDIQSRQYFYDLPHVQDNLYCEYQGFKRFFQRALKPLKLGTLNEAMAKEICKWRYQGLYSVYNLSDWEVVVSNCWELASESARHELFVSILVDESLLGFGRIQCYEEQVLLGVGLRPENCGDGYGAKAMNLLIQEAKRRHPNKEIGLEVRRFNDRAKKCYQTVGFAVKKRYKKETVEGFVDYEYMKLEQ